LLPIPLSLKGKAWPPDERKRVKKARWLTRDAFRRFQVGGKLTLDDLIDIPGVTTVERLHNSIDRATNTTGSAGSLFSQLEMFLEGRTGATPSLDFLTLYARVTEGFEEQLMTLLTDLAKTGFGADLSVGCGEFELLSGLEAADDMGATNSPSNGVVVLSTFQPGSNDPVEGVWDAFTKYGKLGPDFGIDNVFKRPMVCLRPGACFRTERTSEFLGRAIKMDELLAPDVCRVLRERGSEVMHLAYGLSLPATLN
jgi:CRISPR/Cas system CSM-associated protein Csm4 (group 5 of RAMP superfamily)